MASIVHRLGTLPPYTQGMAQKKRRKFTKERPPEPDPVSDHWRLFLAVQLPDRVRSMIETINHELASQSLPLRLVEPRLAHITLHFLGDTAPERAELLKLALPAALATSKPFHLETTTLGVFPNDRKPRVLWLGLGGSIDALRTLHTVLGKTLRAYDFETETRALHPHITIGRTKEDVPPSFAADLATALASAPIHEALNTGPHSIAVTEIALIRSNLEKAGPRYETIRAFRLGGLTRVGKQ